ncbi:MAG: hypothetical protein L3J65_09080 [Robiginitomaculum sp.]|nr:hypothetical protein [Robiginitomaculum sp.]
MTYKATLLLTCLIFSSACTSDVTASEAKKNDAQAATTVTKTTDELGNEIINIKSTRNEGYTVHPSNQINKLTNEFYCKGYKVETFIVKRQENHEVRSIDLTLKVNGEKIDLRPIIGSKSNLYGYSNIETHFSCVDNIVRIMIDGQPYTNDNKLARSTKIIDFLVDRKTGYIKSNSVKK